MTVAAQAVVEIICHHEQDVGRCFCVNIRKNNKNSREEKGRELHTLGKRQDRGDLACPSRDGSIASRERGDQAKEGSRTLKVRTKIFRLNLNKFLPLISKISYPLCSPKNSL